MAGKPIVGPLGRAWTINIPRADNGELKVPWTLLANHPVQGVGADIMKIARVTCYKRIKKLTIPCLFITTVHDSIVVDAESKYLDVIAKVFHETFQSLQDNIQRMFNYTWTVPLECEVKYGPNMRDMQKYLTTPV